jgi:Rieske Fe-S protein
MNVSNDEIGQSRRAVLAGAGAAGVAAVLGGCATYGEKEGGAAAPAAAGALGKTADVPVGGGKIFEDRKVVVTQPTQGTFKCFTAVCTHQGCLVSEVKDGTINCACHGSKFKVADGSVANGPAAKPLAPVTITVEGDSLKI